MKFQMGITLIELLMSIVIMMIILLSLIAIYLASEKSHRIQVALTSIEDNSVFVSQILRNAINQAGYAGCARLSSQFPFVNHTKVNFSEKNKITQENNSLSVRYASSESVKLVKNMRSNSILYVTNTIKFSIGDVLLISDCRSIDVFIIKSIDSSEMLKIISESPLSKQYQENSEVRRLEENEYYIGDTERKNQTGSPVYALYVKDIRQYKTELVEGVDGMHIDINDMGVSIELQLTSTNGLPLKKQWFIYEALRN